MSSEIQKLNVELKKEDLETLLCQQIGSDLTVTSFTSKPLTQPGDNYGSTMLAVEVSYQTNGNNEIIKLPIVAKLVPESPFLRKVFDIENTFRKEVIAYTLVSPVYSQLQKEKGISEIEILDIFPKYYGSRCNKENDDNIDADETAVLLLENLKISGYETLDRRKGFNLKHMEMAVSSLAKFHALSIALKILKPKVFEDTILKACANFILAKMDNDEESEKWTSSVMDILKSIPDCEPYLERVEKSVRAYYQAKKVRSMPTPKEPFATIVHNDFWVNNMMFKYQNSINNGDEAEKYEVPIAMKFVDFQVTIYDSPVRDLMFLLFTSSEDGLLAKHYNNLIDLYHEHFIDILRRLGCNTQPYSFKHFQEELNVFCPKEFSHIICMLNVICANPEGMEETSNLDQDSILSSKGGNILENKVLYLLKTFDANGWL